MDASVCFGCGKDETLVPIVFPAWRWPLVDGLRRIHALRALRPPGEPRTCGVLCRLVKSDGVFFLEWDISPTIPNVILYLSKFYLNLISPFFMARKHVGSTGNGPFKDDICGGSGSMLLRSWGAHRVAPWLSSFAMATWGALEKTGCMYKWIYDIHVIHSCI